MLFCYDNILKTIPRRPIEDPLINIFFGPKSPYNNTPSLGHQIQTKQSYDKRTPAQKTMKQKHGRPSARLDAETRSLTKRSCGHES